MNGKRNSAFWMRILIQTLAMTNIGNRVLSAPIELSLPWETPCAGESTSSINVPAFNSDSTGTATLTLSDLRYPLQYLLDDLTLRKNEIRRLIADPITIEQLDSMRNKLDNFPKPRSTGSAVTTEITIVLKEDYERLSKIFIFIEEASKRRTSLDEVKNKMLEVLCKMVAVGAPITSQLTRDLAPNISDLSFAEQDQYDYVMVKDTVSVIDSLNTEYNSIS